MIPVRRIDHVFVFQRRIRTFDFRQDVMRVDIAQCVLYIKISLGIKHNWLEVFTYGSFLKGIEILTGSRKKLFRSCRCNPRLDGGSLHAPVGSLNIKVLAGPTPGNNFIGIACRFGLVNYDCGCRALLGSNLVLVGPASVVGHRLALESFIVKLARIAGVRHGGIVD